MALVLPRSKRPLATRPVAPNQRPSLPAPSGSRAVDRRGDRRAGRPLTPTVSGHMSQDGKLIGIAIGAYSAPWESPLLPDEPMPEVPPPRGASPSTARAGASTRLHPAPHDAEALRRAALRGSCARRDRRLDRTSRGAAGRRAHPCRVADAWFPAPWPRLTELAPAPTIDLTIHFRVPLRWPTHCSSAASETASCETASSTRTASSRPRIEPWSPNPAS